MRAGPDRRAPGGRAVEAGVCDRNGLRRSVAAVRQRRVGAHDHAAAILVCAFAPARSSRWRRRRQSRDVQFCRVGLDDGVAARSNRTTYADVGRESIRLSSFSEGSPATRRRRNPGGRRAASQAHVDAEAELGHVFVVVAPSGERAFHVSVRGRRIRRCIRASCCAVGPTAIVIIPAAATSCADQSFDHGPLIYINCRKAEPGQLRHPGIW